MPPAARCLPPVVALSLLLSLPAPAPAQEGGATPLDPTAPMPEGYAGDSPGNAAWNDPSHPLKGDEDPGEAWDASNMDRWHDDHRETPPIRSARGDWDWGELFYGRTYPGTLVVTNECEAPQVVNVFVYDLPYLRDLPDRVSVPGRDEVELDVRIVTPPEPDPPINPRPFDPSAPGFGWVEPPPFQPNPFDPTAPSWHQPNFLAVDGRVVLWHPWAGDCTPKRETYHATGHVHFEPPDEEPDDPGPRETAAPTPCDVYWNTGQPPPDLEGADCTEHFRGRAIALLETVLLPRAEEDPGAWEWLPSVAELQVRTADQLLAFRERAEAALGADVEARAPASDPRSAPGGSRAGLSLRTAP